MAYSDRSGSSFSNMNIYCITTFLLLHCLSSVTANEAFFFDPHLYQEGDIFFVQNGTNTTLTCKFKSRSPTNLRIMRRIANRNTLVTIVEYGKITSEFDNGEYILATDADEYRLTLKNVSFDQSSDYHCSYQINHWLYYLLSGEWLLIKLSAQLDVIDVVSDRPAGDCILLSDTGGIYFTGDKIVMSCPHQAVNVSMEGHDDFVISEKQIASSGNYLFVSSALDESYNGKTLSCLFVNVPGDNYCENFPVIRVYEKLTAEVHASGLIDTEDGGSKMEWNCSSNLKDVATFQWEILGQGHVFIGNVTTNETANGTTLVLTSSQFALLSQSQLVVAICRVTFGLRTAEAHATINGSNIETTTLQYEEGTTVFTTHFPVDGGSDGRLCVGAGVIVVLMLLTAVLCFVIAILAHFKLSRRWQMKHVRLDDEHTLM